MQNIKCITGKEIQYFTMQSQAIAKFGSGNIQPQHIMSFPIWLMLAFGLMVDWQTEKNI